MRVGVVSVAVVLLAGAVSAKEVFVGELPVSPSLGTEVSTNVPFNVSRNDVMTFMVEMEQNGVESNNVQVAFGQDLEKLSLKMKVVNDSCYRPRAVGNFDPRIGQFWSLILI